jgi:hypothetical protein
VFLPPEIISTLPLPEQKDKKKYFTAGNGTDIFGTSDRRRYGSLGLCGGVGKRQGAFRNLLRADAVEIDAKNCRRSGGFGLGSVLSGFNPGFSLQDDVQEPVGSGRPGMGLKQGV